VAGTGGAGELGANQKKLVIIERSLLLYTRFYFVNILTN